jgi:hypothetical protein
MRLGERYVEDLVSMEHDMSADIAEHFLSGSLALVTRAGAQPPLWWILEYKPPDMNT